MKKSDVALNETPLKLNYKRTLIIGFAFFGILMLWQVYNTYCPVILTELLSAQTSWPKENVQWIVGVIMALDNVFALFMLPIFGNLSDKTHSKYGKRMPYIIIGTILAAIALIFLPLAFAWNSLVGFIIVMLIVLVTMNVYRNPAVSLMPDVTPKPLRAKANGLINLIGYVGAIVAGALALIITTKNYFVLNPDKPELYKNGLIYVPFIVASVLMVTTMIVLAVSINENKVLKEMEGDLKRGEELAEVETPLVEGEKKLSPANKRNLILMIVAIFLWFAGFNAVETFWSNYYTYYINFSSGSLGTIVLTIASLITFIPAGILAGKIGRKWTVMLGIGLLFIAFLSIFLLSPVFTKAESVSGGLMIGYFAFFLIAGVGWAFINCCSYPMVVELATKDTIGKYTGYYYSSSMIAQSLTPIALGALMLIPNFNYAVTFPYAAILVLASGVVFFFVNNVKQKKVATKKGLEAFDQD